MQKLLFGIGFLFSLSLSSQVTTSPVFPTENDVVTIIYDASQGNGALVGASAIYMHTGLITSLSTGPTNWRYTSSWGTTLPMTSLGNNRWQYVMNAPLRPWYQSLSGQAIQVGEVIQQLAFVFRDASGNTVGRATGGSDIFQTVYSASSNLLASIVSPSDPSMLLTAGQQVQVQASSNINATITLYDNGTQIAQQTGTTLNHTLTASTSGNHMVLMIAQNGGQTVRDSFYYTVNPNVLVQDPPTGLAEGITYMPNGDVFLKLFAPNKQFAYVIGSFNQWRADVNYFMRKSVDGNTWWIQIPGLAAGQYHLFQYWVDGQIKTGDPYSELILDPWNDHYIPTSTFPNRPVYPVGLTTDPVTVLTPGFPAYSWRNTTFNAPGKKDLVVYELLMRDFLPLATRSYQTMIDTLPYLKRLGVNVIQFMPVNEFEGNESWGYNPSYHMALDKAYGTKNKFKEFVDSCHANGIAVVLDVVFNQVTGLSPLAKLYWDGANNRPSAQNPWLNVTARHPFNVFEDVNHDSPYTRNWISQVMRYWIQEYKIDGFRFDLSKGFTQTNSGGDVGLWGQYDAGRIANIKRIADSCWVNNPDHYVILEHFSDNWEEIELSNYGCMLWGNANCTSNQASMGHATGGCNWDFGWGLSYAARGWGQPNLVGYMESHDEERLMYKNKMFGNGNIAYNLQPTNLVNATKRMELMGNIFFCIPGPKMIWQFGELGYDESIYLCSNGTVSTTGGCRTDAKPIKWQYYNNTFRRNLYNVWSRLIKLKKEQPAFETSTFNMTTGGNIKGVWLNHSSMNVVSLGNFSTSQQSAIPNFQHTGWWYEFHTGDSINVSSTTSPLNLQGGEYRLYTDVNLRPRVITSVEENSLTSANLSVFPNPSSGAIQIAYSLPKSGEVSLKLFDMMGRQIASPWNQYELQGDQMLDWDMVADGFSSGLYFLQLTLDGKTMGVQKVILD